MEKSNINIIISKLDEFIKRYYVNEFLKGLIVFVLIAGFYFLAISCIEYFAFFPTTVRTCVFYGSLILASLTFVKYVCVPFIHIYKIGKVLSYEEAAKIVSKFFPEIQDTLQNTLELSSDESLQDNALAIAAINQKIKALQPIPFISVFDFKQFISYWKYAAGLVFVVILVTLFYPHAIVDGAKRIVKHNEQFEKPAPFRFILDNDSLSVVKGSDFSIVMHVEGDYIPDEVQLQFGGNMFAMVKKTASTFEYVLRGCNQSITFNFQAENYSSKQFVLDVYPLPQLLQFTLHVTVPSYTQMDNFTEKNTGDISFPIGSKIAWSVDAVDVDSLFYVTDNKRIPFQKRDAAFILNQTILQTEEYALIGKNEYLDSVQIINYTFTAIPDVRPAIQVEQQRDSVKYFTYYFKGEMQDDYGFSSLDFVYYTKENEAEKVRVPVDFSPAITHQQFFYMFDFSQFTKGESVQYYFETFDNDAINGRKSARTSVYECTIPTQEELEKLQEQYTEQIASSFEESSSIAQDLMKDFEKLKQKLLNENLSDWERKQVLDEMQAKQQQIKQQVESLQQSLQQKNELQKQLSKQDEEMLRKQQEINELLNNLMDDELRKMMEEFEKMREEFNKNDFIKKSEDMKMSYEELSKQLDRDLELLKRMDVEQQVQMSGERLEELAREQQQLSEEMKNGKNSDEIEQKMKQISEELQSIEKNYNDAKEKNEELQQKYELQNFDKQFQDIQNSMQHSQSEQEQKQSNKASKSMKKAADETKQLAQSMQGMMQQQMQQQAMEDMANLRQILENLVTFSFKQEDLLNQTKKLSYADPKYAETADNQNALRENFQIIKDSLYTLSTRVPQISQSINSEVFEIYKNGAVVLDNLEQRQRGLAQMNQQYIMTSANNLALLLSEVLDAMQQQAAQQMEGQQQCQNPRSSGKGAKPSFQQMKQMQESLKSQMQEMMKQMKNGGMPSQQMQKQLSEMLMKEQMLKQMANTMMQNGELSPEGVQQLKDIQRLMDQTERDIINQNITPQTMMRQEQILTRMLEAENSKHERDKDKERESKTAKETPSETAKKQFQQTEKDKQQYGDMLQENSIKLKPQYQKMYSDYIMNLEER